MSAQITDKNHEKSIERKSSKHSRRKTTDRRTTLCRMTRQRTTYTTRRRTIHGSNDSIRFVRIYEPTYQLESNNPMDIEYVRRLVIQSTHEVTTWFPKYQPEMAMKVANELSRDIKFRLKILQYDRYRLIVCVNVIQKQYQGICMQMGFLWDREKDLWTSYNLETKTYIVSVVVLGIYQI